MNLGRSALVKSRRPVYVIAGQDGWMSWVLLKLHVLEHGVAVVIVSASVGASCALSGEMEANVRRWRMRNDGFMIVQIVGI